MDSWARVHRKRSPHCKPYINLMLAYAGLYGLPPARENEFMRIYMNPHPTTSDGGIGADFYNPRWGCHGVASKSQICPSREKWCRQTHNANSSLGSPTSAPQSFRSGTSPQSRVLSHVFVVHGALRGTKSPLGGPLTVCSNINPHLLNPLVVLFDISANPRGSKSSEDCIAKVRSKHLGACDRGS